MEVQINTQRCNDMQFSRYTVSFTTIIIPLRSRHLKDVAGTLFGRISGIGSKQDMFQMPAYIRISAIRKGGRNLITVHTKRSRFLFHQITSLP